MLNLPAWTRAVHHDGSAHFVSNLLPTLGETIHIRLSIPADAPIKAVFLRSDPDGEAHLAPMQRESDSIWLADFRVTMPQNTYRFKLLTEEGAYYLNALGISRADKPNWFDFKILADYAAPTWVWDAIFYQIFPDRFHNGDPERTVKPAAWSHEGFTVYLRGWDELPHTYQQGGNVDFFGGDLAGIIQKLDYLQALGITALYLNPIFPSHTNHRYDIQDFFRVDEYLGGDEALIALRQALDERGMKLILDVTPNHISWKHPWFTAAQKDQHSPLSEFFTFHDEARQHYETWMGVRSLVKLNYASQKLRDTMYRDSDSILRHWLAAPFRIDGWRLDVLNMTARQGKNQLLPEVGREMRAILKADNPQVYLMGEHFFDGTAHLQGDQMDGMMNYQGFNIPLRRWLSGYDAGADWERRGREDVDWALLPTEALAEQIQNYLAAIPWVVALQQFNQLDSHDTIRFLSALGGNKGRFKIAAALLMSFVGTPCLYYGDEVGLEGKSDPDNRRPMPWGNFDEDLLSFFQKLTRLRHDSLALRQGGFQILYAEGDIFAYQRHHHDELVIVVAHRGAVADTKFLLPVGAGITFTDYLNGEGYAVHEEGYLHLKPESIRILLKNP